MLDVAYEAVEDLAPGRLAAIEEDRGTVRLRLDKTRPLADVVRQLNIEVDRLMSSSHWFQLWGTEIVSRDTPDQPLQIQHIIRPWVPRDLGVGLAEDRGIIRVYICPDLDPERFAAAVNPPTEKILGGGRWFQLYAGEIIDNSPGPMSRI
ncbi:hypothetical protein ACWCPF_26275 [Streptomyces sp. NPDC001858]